MSDSGQPCESQSALTQEQIERSEKNRKRALEIRREKEESLSKIAKLSSTAMSSKKLIDSGAGFYLDEEDLILEKEKSKKLVELPPAPSQDQQLICIRCDSKFAHSFLTINFSLDVCDSCRTEHPDDYDLITKTDAREEFLLKDCDFDFREPPLKFMVKKNPHKKYGDMKLYLRCQCRERAMIVHENEEELEMKKEVKVMNLQKTRQKNYEKKIKELRKETRNVTKKTTKFHEHDYGEEIEDEEKDCFYKICKTCDFRYEYEIM